MWAKHVLIKELLQARPLIYVLAGYYLIGFTCFFLSYDIINFTVVDEVPYPFLGFSFLSYYYIGAYFIAIVMGFWQTLWEFGRGTWLFYLHRPKRRGELILAKVFSGLIIVQVVTLLPALLFGLYISVPGVLPAPFEWWMVVGFFKPWALLPLVYLGAFSSGMRDARWYVSKLFPFITASALTFVLSVGELPFELFIGLVSFLTMAMLASLVQDFNNRDYS